MPKEPSILIVGTGAMACLFASRFAAARIPVTMLGTWREGLAAIAESGVIVVEESGEARYPVTATDDPAACTGTTLALVMVKAWQTERAAGQLAECLAPDGLALTLQNGLGNAEALASTLGSHRVVIGSTTAGACLEGAGRVRLAGEGVITLGQTLDGVETISDLFRGAGFEIEVVRDVKTIQWGKLVINAAINPIAALLRVPNGELLRRPSARDLLRETAREAAAVAAAQDVELPYGDAVLAVENVVMRTATNHASMLQDVVRGARTEIDAISGAIVRAGERAGVSVPINRTLRSLVRAASEESP